MSPETRPKSSGTLEKRAPDRRWAGTIVSIRNDLALEKQDGGWLSQMHFVHNIMHIWNFQSWSNISSWSEVHYSSVNWSLHHWLWIAFISRIFFRNLQSNVCCVESCKKNCFDRVTWPIVKTIRRLWTCWPRAKKCLQQLKWKGKRWLIEDNIWSEGWWRLQTAHFFKCGQSVNK